MTNPVLHQVLLQVIHLAWIYLIAVYAVLAARFLSLFRDA